MSPRQRTISDTDVLAAAANVIGRVGSAALTLAQVGLEAGLAPATLLQRFGSRRGLLLALAESWSEGVGATFAAVRADFDSPVAALIELAAANVAGVERAGQPDGELANRLTILQADLGDEAFHKVALDYATRVREGYRRLIAEAIADGELAECEVEALARAVESIANGAMISWTIHREGGAATFVRREVATLLRGYGRGVWARP